jgi:hypothetical protein
MCFKYISSKGNVVRHKGEKNTNRSGKLDTDNDRQFLEQNVLFSCSTTFVLTEQQSDRVLLTTILPDGSAMFPSKLLLGRQL